MKSSEKLVAEARSSERAVDAAAASKIRAELSIAVSYKTEDVELDEVTSRRWDRKENVYIYERDPHSSGAYVKAQVEIHNQAFPITICTGSNALEVWQEENEGLDCLAACSASGLGPEELWAVIEPLVERIHDELIENYCERVEPDPAYF